MMSAWWITMLLQWLTSYHHGSWIWLLSHYGHCHGPLSCCAAKKTSMTNQSHTHMKLAAVCPTNLRDSRSLMRIIKTWNSDAAQLQVVNRNFTRLPAQTVPTLTLGWELFKRRSSTPPTPQTPLSLYLFLSSNQPSGSKCVCVCVCVCARWGILDGELCKDEWWPAVLCTRCNPMWLSLSPRTPQPLARPYIRSPSPTPMPPSLAEPRNYFLRETYCLPAPLSLITIEQKQALTGATRRAALMSAPSPSIFFFFIFFPANGRILTCQPLFLTARHHFPSSRDGM